MFKINNIEFTLPYITRSYESAISRSRGADGGLTEDRMWTKKISMEWSWQLMTDVEFQTMSAYFDSGFYTIFCDVIGNEFNTTATLSLEGGYNEDVPTWHTGVKVKIQQV